MLIHCFLNEQPKVNEKLLNVPHIKSKLNKKSGTSIDPLLFFCLFTPPSVCISAVEIL